MKLCLMVDTRQGIILGLHALLEVDVVSHLVVELHEVGVLSLYLPLVEIAVWQTYLDGLSGIPSLNQFFKIHRFCAFLIDFVGQKYT